MTVGLLAAFFCLGLAAQPAAAVNTNACKYTPTNAAAPAVIPFGPNVIVFNPSQSIAEINAALNVAVPKGGVGFQFYFMPGTYGDATQSPPQIPGVAAGSSPSTADMLTAANAAGIISAPIGANTVLAGLGKSPCDVVINGALFIQDGSLSVTQRRLINMTINPIEANTPENTMHWASSQNAIWRRVNFLGGVEISNLETGSQNFGAMFANSNIAGNILAGNGMLITTDPLQPDGYGNNTNGMYYVQGSTIGGFSGYAGLFEFIGTKGAPAQNFAPGPSAGVPGGDIGNLEKLPVVREAPFVYYNSKKAQFEVFKPSVQRNRKGYDWRVNSSTGKFLPLSSFYIADPAVDTATTLNAQLAAGKNLMLNPGTYNLSETLIINKPDTMVLALGVPVLKSAAGVQTLKITDKATGTILYGFNVTSDAPGAVVADYQLQIGVNGGTGKASNPTSITDVNVASRAFIAEVINQNYVIQNQGEINTSTDSTSAATWGTPDGSHGIMVNGDNVTLQGLYVEHYKKFPLIWYGNKGQVHYMVNEPPYTPYYDTPNVLPTTWQWATDFHGYPSIYIDYNVKQFSLEGYLTAYRFNKGCRCEITAGIVTPVKKGIKFRNVLGTGITFPAPAGTTNVYYDPSELNGEHGQVPRYIYAAPGLLKSLPQFSTNGYYAVGGFQKMFGILGEDGTITPVGPGALLDDVAPGPGSYGPAGTCRQPFSDLIGFGITTRITEFSLKNHYEN